MKSKIQTKQILMKGIATFILSVMLLSCMSLISPRLVIAAEDEVEEDPDFNIASEDSELDYIQSDSEMNSITSSIKDLEEQLHKMESYSDKEYNAFMEELKNNDTITIDSELKLRALSIYVAEGNSCTGKTFNMTNNIALTSTLEWEPIGSSEKPFSGTFNGYGHTISSMRITSQNNNVGLFGYTKNATIKNIKISKNCTINIPLDIANDRNDLVSTTAAKYSYLGAIVGYAKNTSITNCTNEADVLGGSAVGGIVGCFYDDSGKHIIDCINKGGISGLGNVGGIAGKVYGISTDKYTSVQRSRNTGTIFAVVIDVGGIVGTLKGNAKISQSENAGQISTNTELKSLKVNGKNTSVEPQNAGGIVGATGGTEQTNKADITTRIEKSINKGTVYGYRDIGGIVGQLGNISGGYSVASDCINYTNDIKGYKTKGTTVYTGKIAGWVGSDSKTQTGRAYNCYYLIQSDNEDKGTKTHWALNTVTKSDDKLVRAIGGYSGPTSGDNFKGNSIDWKIKESEGKYYFQGGMYKIENGALKSDGYTVYYKVGNEKYKWYSRANNSNPGSNGTNGKAITINEDTTSSNYQKWLYRISKYFEFTGDCSPCMIDNTSPSVKSEVTISTKSGLRIAVPGDVIRFEVKLSERINTASGMNLKVTIGDPTKSQELKNVKFVGIDNDQAIFEYTVKDTNISGGISETDEYTNKDYMISKLKITGTITDTFENKSLIDQEINVSRANVNENNVIIMDQSDSINAMYFGKKIQTGLDVVYKFYDGNYINEKDKIYYNNSNFTVKVNINARLFDSNITGNNVPDVKLKIKLNDGTVISLDKQTSSKIDPTDENTTWLYYNSNKLIDGKQIDNQAIKEIWLESEEIYYTSVSNTITLSSSNTKYSQNNIQSVVLDTIEPTFAIEYSTKQSYTVGDSINIKLTSNEELFSTEKFSLQVKFGEVDGKGKAQLVSGPIKNSKNQTELIYQYMIQEGDNGKLSIYTNGITKDLALNTTDLSKQTYPVNDKYVDTTAPTVDIIAKNGTETIENRTNAKEITYTFEWSEEVIGFTEDDITIIGGKIKEGATLEQDATDKTKYTLQVIPNVSNGNEGEVQVIVEAGRCKDGVNLTNIRKENKIVVDKKAPTFINYNVTQDNTVIKIEAIFDEAIGTANKNDIEVKFGKDAALGTIDEDVQITGNKVIYTYHISGADEGTPTITLKENTVKDVAGNSNNTSYVLENKEIILEKHVIKVGSDEYSFSKNDNVITNFTNPTYFKEGDVITVTKVGTTTTYTYTVSNKYADNTQMSYMKLTEKTGTATTGSAEFSANTQNDYIDISAANIYFDTTAPSLATKVYAENGKETGIYNVGDKVIVEVTTSEKISEKDTLVPEIQISFTKSGFGKYNYQEDKAGYAKFERKVENSNGTITWYYAYVIQNGDEGALLLNYQSGELVDLAGNATDVKQFNTLLPTTGNNNLSTPTNFDTAKVRYEIKKNGTKIEKFDSNTYFTKGDNITVIATINKKLYTTWGSTETPIVSNTAPKLSLLIKNQTLAGNLVAKAVSTNNYTTTLEYEYTIKENDKEGKIDTLTLDRTTATYYAKDEEHTNLDGTLRINPASTTTTNITDCNLVVDIKNTHQTNNVENITADTIAPTVNITAKHGEQAIDKNITNADELTYTFDWSEEVKDFTKEDIIIHGGRIKEDTQLVQDEADKTKYTLIVIPNIFIGNEGEVQVIVEAGICQDIAGHQNVRTESSIKVDKKAPILISLEAYADSTINVDGVKEYYKVGDTVTVIATFNENIEKTKSVPALALQFSESGNTKGNVSAGRIEGNKITYTYTITEGDNGNLSVKGFSGTVVDVAGNETIVTKRNLDGDTIIADTMVSDLIGITVITPKFEYDELLEDPKDTKRYGVESKTREHNTITMIAEYSKNVYYLDGTDVNEITDKTAPVLKLKFGTGTERTASFAKVEGNKIYYTYHIQSGDNGNLEITSLAGTVSNISGNTMTMDSNSDLPAIVKYEETITEENKIDSIIADTRKPTFSAIAEDKADNGNKITGNGNYYRKGSMITITATADEYLYANSNKNLSKFTEANMPTISLKFGNIAAKGNVKEKKVEYKEHQTIFTYQYIIQQDDNGILNINIEDSAGYDIALNGNSSKTQEITNIIADTVAPYIATNTNEKAQWKITSTPTSVTATGTFSELLYVMSEEYQLNLLTNAKDAPIMGVFADGELKGTAQATISHSEGKTTITYQYNTSQIDANNISVNIIDKTLYDRAGNEWSLQVNEDTASPKFYQVQVLTEDGYYKKDDVLNIVVKFHEITQLTQVPTLKIKIGDKEINLNGTILPQDELNTAKVKVARYSYTINDENGSLQIISLKGEASDGIRKSTIDKELAKADVIKNDQSQYDEKVFVDTTAPTVTITSDVEKTNQDRVTYTFTWSEPVFDFTTEDIEVTNGSKGNFEKVNDTTYILTVDTTNEGRQVVKVNANACVDRAGNQNTEGATYNKVWIDYTKPEIRAKVNGGNYVIDTDSAKATLKETIVVNEEVLKFEYIWTRNTEIPSTGFTAINPETIQVNSDIHLTTQIAEEGTYYLYVKITDKAGNVLEGKTNGFVVTNAQISLTPNTSNLTNQDVTIEVDYGKGLTENKLAGVQGKTHSADPTKVVVTENGTVYAEATDIAGNKVYATVKIENIDKEAPKAEISYEDEEDGSVIATISFDEDNVTITNNEGETSYTFTENGIFTFKFRDEAGNNSEATAIVTTIKPKEDDSDIIFEGLSTIYMNGTRYVKVSPNMTIENLKSKMNKEALKGKEVDFINLANNNKLKTGSEIQLNGETRYIIIVKGDVNCDGKVDFLGDVVLINNYRLGVVQGLNVEQILAGDINNNGNIDFIPDIVAINNYRLGTITSL